jgi:hypothetical protein
MDESTKNIIDNIDYNFYNNNCKKHKLNHKKKCKKHKPKCKNHSKIICEKTSTVNDSNCSNKNCLNEHCLNEHCLNELDHNHNECLNETDHKYIKKYNNHINNNYLFKNHTSNHKCKKCLRDDCHCDIILVKKKYIGPTGVRGPPGPRGLNSGFTGPTGERGFIGPMGLRGETGPTGAKGDAYTNIYAQIYKEEQVIFSNELGSIKTIELNDNIQQSNSTVLNTDTDNIIKINEGGVYKITYNLNISYINLLSSTNKNISIYCQFKDFNNISYIDSFGLSKYLINANQNRTDIISSSFLIDTNNFSTTSGLIILNTPIELSLRCELQIGATINNITIENQLLNIMKIN